MAFKPKSTRPSGATLSAQIQEEADGIPTVPEIAERTATATHAMHAPNPPRVPKTEKVVPAEKPKGERIQPSSEDEKTVNICFRCSQQMLKSIMEGVDGQGRYGSHRTFFAKLMRDAGFDVLDIDINPRRSKRVIGGK